MSIKVKNEIKSILAVDIEERHLQFGSMDRSNQLLINDRMIGWCVIKVSYLSFNKIVYRYGTSHRRSDKRPLLNGLEQSDTVIL